MVGDLSRCPFTANNSRIENSSIEEGSMIFSRGIASQRQRFHNHINCCPHGNSLIIESVLISAMPSLPKRVDDSSEQDIPNLGARQNHRDCT